jgi:hypothetical protein
MSNQKDTAPLQCSLPPREALRRAMMVEPPDDWKKKRKPSRSTGKKPRR